MTLSETLVPFAEITFSPNTILDFYRGGYDPVRDTCTLRKNHLFSGRTFGIQVSRMGISASRNNCDQQLPSSSDVDGDVLTPASAAERKGLESVNT